jgi:hypothetical protein
MKPRFKPRNLVAPSAKLRKAGAHDKSKKAKRREAKLALAKALAQSDG